MTKKWHISNKFLIFGISVAIALTIITALIFTKTFQSNDISLPNPNYSLCPAMTEPQIKPKSLQFHPIKIVAEPWRGEHHVYAIFALPLQYKDIYYRSELLVKGTDTAWDVTIANEREYGLTIPDGYFVVIGFFRTRIAMWYLISGRFNDLQQPCNWTLHLFL